MNELTVIFKSVEYALYFVAFIHVHCRPVSNETVDLVATEFLYASNVFYLKGHLLATCLSSPLMEGRRHVSNNDIIFNSL